MIAVSEAVSGEIQWQFVPDGSVSVDLPLSVFVLKNANFSVVFWLLVDRYNCGNYYTEEF